MDIVTTKNALALAALALLAPGHAAFAGEALAGLDGAETAVDRKYLESPCLTTTGSLAQVRELARGEAASISATKKSLAEPLAVNLDAKGVIGEVLDLEGVPLVRLSDDDEKKTIYFGISFDGVVGVHGKL